MIMTNLNFEKPPAIGLYELYHKVDSETFYIDSNCILMKDKLIRRFKVYELHDSVPEGVVTRLIKILWIYLKGFNFYIIATDTQTGELLRRTQRLGQNSLICNFVLMEPLHDPVFLFDNEAEDNCKENGQNN